MSKETGNALAQRILTPWTAVAVFASVQLPRVLFESGGLPAFVPAEHFHPLLLFSGIRPAIAGEELRPLSSAVEHGLRSAGGGAAAAGAAISGAMAVALLYLLVKALFGSRSGAWLAAAWFAVSPVHVEALQPASEGFGQILASCFLMGGWLIWLRARRGSAPFYLLHAPAVFFLLALLSSDTVWTFPAILMLGEVLVEPSRPDEPFRARWSQNTILLHGSQWLVAILYVGWRLLFAGSNVPNPALNPLALEGTVAQLRGTLLLMVHAIGLQIAPVALQSDASWILAGGASQTMPLVLAAASALGIGLLTALAWRRAAWAAFGVAFFGLAFLPASPLFGPVRAFSESALWWPSVGIAIVAGLALPSFLAKMGASWRRLRIPEFLVGAAVTVLVVFALSTILRERAWRDAAALVTEDLDRNPASVLLRTAAAGAALQGGDLAAAREHLEIAYRIQPGSPEAAASLATVLSRLGKHDEAVRLAEVAQRLRPDDPALELNEAAALRAAGNLEAARRLAKLILEGRPDYEPAAAFRAALAPRTQ